jgi:hypothetical protein
MVRAMSRSLILSSVVSIAISLALVTLKLPLRSDDIVVLKDLWFARAGIGMKADAAVSLRRSDGEKEGRSSTTLRSG